MIFGAVASTISIFLLFSTQVHAQEKQKPTLIVGLNNQYGFIIPHSEELKEISASNPWGLAADISKLNYSDKSWRNCNCYSKLGLSFAYYNYQNPDQLGSSYNLILFVEPYLGFRRKVHISLRAGMGATYLDKVYDEVTNPENLFYSSPLSFILLVQLKLYYKINKNNSFYLSGNYNHISNGAISKPNKGMNFPTIGLGYEHTIRPVPLIKKNLEDDFDPRKIGKYMRIFWNVRTVPETPEYKEQHDIMIGMEAGILKRLSRINGLLTGMEFSYDGLYNEEINRQNLDSSPYIFSLHFGHYFIFGKFSFTQQMAWYVYKSYPFNEQEFFQRYAIYWQFNKWINCGFSLKSHGHVAEYMDVRMGVSF